MNISHELIVTVSKGLCLLRPFHPFVGCGMTITIVYVKETMKFISMIRKGNPTLVRIVSSMGVWDVIVAAERSRLGKKGGALIGTAGTRAVRTVRRNINTARLQPCAFNSYVRTPDEASDS